jgi:predicted regulator of Ras-like GTPase activity (Roadblock/LC7/MglB family)
MSLPSIFQVNCTERNNARLSLKHGRFRGDIYFADGDVVHATTGSEVGEEAVYRLLSWKDADFELEMDILAPERTIETGWSGLLLEGMRRLDEASAGVDELGASDTQAIDEVAGAEKGVMSDMLQELAKALTTIENVTGVVIASRDGVVLADELEEGDPEREGAVAVFVGNAAGVVGDPLALGTFQWGTANIGKETVLVLDQEEYHVGLILGNRASPAMVASSAQTILRNGA